MSDDTRAGVHDGVVAFARERGLTARPVTTASDCYTVELPKGQLLIEVVFKNSTQPDPRAVSTEEWFTTARDPLTSEKLWSDRFSYWEWFDHFGDAERELPDEEWLEGMGDQLIAFLEALLRSKVRLAQVEKKPLVRLFGWRCPKRERENNASASDRRRVDRVEQDRSALLRSGGLSTCK